MALENAYYLLGLQTNASLDEIKKAYRAKAFLLHPDKNNASNAQQQFIELTEAYQLLLDVKNNRYKKYTSPFAQADPVNNAKRDEAKRKAREYAQMRYEEFEKTEAAQAINAFNTILDHSVFLFSTLLILAVPFVLMYFYEFTGLVLGLLFLLAVGRPIFNYTKHFFKPKQLWLALMGLVETYFFRVVIVCFANVYIVFKYGLQTMLPLYALLLILVVPALVSYFVFFKKVEYNKRLFNSLCLAPLFVNVIVLINFFGSSHPTYERYEIWDEFNHTKTAMRQSTLIQLENNKYGHYVGIRIFADIRQMQNCEHIIYQFEDGLLGVRVMKDYRFMP